MSKLYIVPVRDTTVVAVMIAKLTSEIVDTNKHDYNFVSAFKNKVHLADYTWASDRKISAIINCWGIATDLIIVHEFQLQDMFFEKSYTDQYTYWEYLISVDRNNKISCVK